MTETGDIDIRRWVWVLLPWVAAAIAALDVYLLPSAECNGGPTGQRGPFVTVAFVAIAILVGGAAVRVAQLAAAPRSPGAESWFLLGLCTALSITAIVLNLGLHRGLGPPVIFGFALGLIVYLAMAIGVVQRGSDAVGVLVPIAFLFVAGLLIAPFAELGYVVAEGGFC